MVAYGVWWSIDAEGNRYDAKGTQTTIIGILMERRFFEKNFENATITTFCGSLCNLL